jgi:hypothetical protein
MVPICYLYACNMLGIWLLYCWYMVVVLLVYGCCIVAFCTFSPEGEKILGLGIKNKQVYFVLLSIFCIFV